MSGWHAGVGSGARRSERHWPVSVNHHTGEKKARRPRHGRKGGLVRRSRRLTRVERCSAWFTCRRSAPVTGTASSMATSKRARRPTRRASGGDEDPRDRKRSPSPNPRPVRRGTIGGERRPRDALDGAQAPLDEVEGSRSSPAGSSPETGAGWNGVHQGPRAGFLTSWAMEAARRASPRRAHPWSAEPQPAPRRAPPPQRFRSFITRLEKAAELLSNTGASLPGSSSSRRRRRGPRQRLHGPRASRRANRARHRPRRRRRKSWNDRDPQPGPFRRTASTASGIGDDRDL